MLVAAASSSPASTAEPIVAACGLIVAALALVTSFYFGWLQRKHFRLSSKPMLDIEVGCVDTVLGLNNEGVGPATLERFIAAIDGEEIDLLSASGIDKFVNRLLSGATTFPDMRMRGLLKGSVIAAGGTARMVYSEEPLPTDHRDRILQNFQRVRLTAEYRCIYDCKFEATSAGFG
ncbi:hypothetical protein [Stenotrophomonas sp.]|uniref:hypothetical protein n=1 Tax=Stenotrophomonas sp. TaxID=69392 RepID=UPI002FC96187